VLRAGRTFWRRAPRRSRKTIWLCDLGDPFADPRNSIGLGFVKGGAARIGEIVRAWDGLRGDDIEIEICSPVFYDPKGERPHG